MSTEKYNFEKDNKSYFQTLLLGSDTDSINELTSQEDFDPDNLEVKLEVNGMVVRVEDFNNLLSRWGELVLNNIKEKLEYQKSQEAVVEKAEDLIKGKLGNVQEVLNDIENNLWKLEC